MLPFIPETPLFHLNKLIDHETYLADSKTIFTPSTLSVNYTTANRPSKLPAQSVPSQAHTRLHLSLLVSCRRPHNRSPWPSVHRGTLTTISEVISMTLLNVNIATISITLSTNAEISFQASVKLVPLPTTCTRQPPLLLGPPPLLGSLIRAPPIMSPHLSQICLSTSSMMA